MFGSETGLKKDVQNLVVPQHKRGAKNCLFSGGSRLKRDYLRNETIYWKRMAAYISSKFDTFWYRYVTSLRNKAGSKAIGVETRI